MTWHTDKMAWAKAVAHVANILGSEDHAVDELMALVIAGAIAAFDRCVVNGSIVEIKLTPEYLQRNATATGIVKAGKRARGDMNLVPPFLFNNIPGQHHVFLSRTAVLKSWPPAATKPPEAALGYPTKDTRGNRRNYDWEKILIAAAVMIYTDGLPKDQNDLATKVHEYFSGTKDWEKGGPGPTQMKAHLGPLYRAVKDAS